VHAILAEETLVTCATLSGVQGVGRMLDPACDSEDLPKFTRLELPLWLVPALARRGMLQLGLPRWYNERMQRKMQARRWRTRGGGLGRPSSWRLCIMRMSSRGVIVWTGAGCWCVGPPLASAWRLRRARMSRGRTTAPAHPGRASACTDAHGWLPRPPVRRRARMWRTCARAAPSSTRSRCAWPRWRPWTASASSSRRPSARATRWGRSPAVPPHACPCPPRRTKPAAI